MRRRLTVSYLLLTLVVLLALAFPLGLSISAHEHDRVRDDAVSRAALLASRVASVVEARHDEDPVLDGRAVERLVTDTSRGPGRAHVIAPAATAPIAVSNALTGRTITVERSVHGRAVLQVVTPVVVDGVIVGAASVTVPLAVVTARVRADWLLVGGLCGVIALVVLLVSVLLARSFSSPIAALHESATRLGDGDLAARVPVPDDPPELRALARSFNTTAERLGRALASQQAFVADASHQLRTPLAALRLRLENLEAEAPECGVDDLSGAIGEVQRLSALVDGLLAMARAEQTASTPVAVELGPVVEVRCDAWAALAAERGVRLVADVEPAVARATPGRLEQVLDNLLNNALDAAPLGSEVRVTVVGEELTVRLEVRDHGPGMTPDQRARAFDRFWRGRDASREGGGFGLGLSIVRELLVTDGGSVDLDDAPDGGLVVTVRLPVADRVRGTAAVA